MKKQTAATIGIFGLVAILFVAIAISPAAQYTVDKKVVSADEAMTPVLSAPQLAAQDGGMAQAIKYKGHVQVWKTHEGITTKTFEGDNQLQDGGKAFMVTQLSGSANATNLTKYISLSNDAVPATSATVLTNEITANGLDRNTTGCVIAANTTAGFDCTAIFIASGSQAYQTAGLNWVGVDNQGSSLFASVAVTADTVVATDTVTVKWTVVFS